MKYTPEVNDYVKWRKHEGWVYFKDNEHITIEVGVIPKKECPYIKKRLHKFDHILIVCYRHNWNELQYVRSRKSKYEK